MSIFELLVIFIKSIPRAISWKIRQFISDHWMVECNRCGDKRWSKDIRVYMRSSFAPAEDDEIEEVCLNCYEERARIINIKFQESLLNRITEL